MRKIFSLLAALILLSASSVWAQDASTSSRKFSISETPTPAAELTSGYYILKVACKSKVGYAFVRQNVDLATATAKCYGINYQDGFQTDTIGTHNSLAYVWYVGTTPDSKMLCIQNAGDASYFPKQSNHDNYDMKEVRTFANAAAFRHSDVYEGLGVMLYQTNEKMNGGIPYVHANGDETSGNPFTMSCWEGFNKTDGSASNCFFTFYKLNIEEDFTSNATPAIPIYKYKQQIDGVDNETIENENNVIVMKMNEAPIVKPWETTYSSELYDAPSVSITSSTDAVIFNFTSKSNSYCRPNTYYKLKVRGEDKYVYASGTKAQDLSVIAEKDFVMTYSPERYWQFEKNGLGVKMRCLNGKYIKVSTPSANNTTVMAELVDDKADASTFYMEGKPSKSGTDKGFSLKYAANTYLGDHIDQKFLGVWRHDTEANKDKGSCFVIESNLNNDLATAKKLLSARLNMEQPSVDANILRVATTEQIESAKAALDAATDMQGVVAAYNKAFTATPNANAFYRIVCLTKGGNRYPSSEDIVVATDGSLATYYNAASDADKGKINRTVTRKKSTDLLVPQLWQFESQSDGSYKIKNANNGCCWGGNASLIDMPINNADGGNYRIVALPTKDQLTSIGSSSAMTELNDGVTTFQLLLDGNVINANAGTSGTTLAAYNNHDADTGNYWQIEKIENFDVAISDAQYATVGYPFPVQVTNNDVKVYYATEAKNGILKLTEAIDNIIPANEGAILYSESGATTANMNILASTNVTFADNKLTATTAKREGFTTLTTYGLSNMNGVVCFRKNSSTNVPANKAYLDADNYTSNSGSAQQLLFSFDNVVEGIDNVVKAQNANKVYYDLQGHRVLYPAHGIFVTENGEKVFIK